MQYLIKRILLIFPVLVGVSIVIFLIVNIIPGDPVQAMFSGTGASAEKREAMRHELGLDLPLHEQYIRYLLKVVRGDFGQSYHFNQPVLVLILERMPATIELTAAGLLVALSVAFPIGIISAWKHNTLIDRLTMAVATIGISLPTFWIGILLIMIIAVKLEWLPGFGRISYGVDLRNITGLYIVDSLLTGNMLALKDALAHLLLPGGATGIAVATLTTRMIRSSVLEVIGQDYVSVARAKGLSEWITLVRHVLRNALIPVVTLIGVQIGALLGGVVVIETIFAWPGIGRLVIQAIYSRDFMLVQGVVIFFAMIRIFINLVTDVLYVWIDPRIGHI
ncbi:MAG: ABC transporter permease [Anaerolineales bacterium]|nr:ABC transporter permease [Anaerolineales bacterium]